jgi:hypothetical protein
MRYRGVFSKQIFAVEKSRTLQINTERGGLRKRENLLRRMIKTGVFAAYRIKGKQAKRMLCFSF